MHEETNCRKLIISRFVVHYSLILEPNIFHALSAHKLDAKSHVKESALDSFQRLASAEGVNQAADMSSRLVLLA